MRKNGRRWFRDKYVYATVGVLLGLGAPAGWLVARALFSRPEWIVNELNQYGSLYKYLAYATVTVFSFFGYFLGRRSDAIRDQNDSVKETLEKVNQLAMTDALTNVHNARYLHEHIAIEIESAKRYNAPLTCLMIDIDDFKAINDQHGHPFGDAVLTTLASILRQCVRRVDIVGRLGGEEFLVLMPHTPMDVAYPVAERIRQFVQQWPFKIGEGEAMISVTISIGLAAFPSPGIEGKTELLKAADEAMYEAKHAGKNRTVLYKSKRV